MNTSPLEIKMTQEYRALLSQIEAPGHGCHPSLIQPARKGVRLGLSDDQIIADLRAHIPHGDRGVSDRELANTLRTARAEEPVVIGASSVKRKPRTKMLHSPKLPALNAKEVFLQARSMILAGEAVDITQLSPTNVAEMSPAEFVRQVFQPDDHILIGDKFSDGGPRDPDGRGRSSVGLGVQPRDVYIKWLEAGNTAPLIWPQTFTGSTAKNKEGKDSYRCNNSVRAYQHCIIEFDDEEIWPLDRQLQFWAGVIHENILPVVALVHSGNKSIHAWLPIKATNEATWKTVADRLLDPKGGFFGVLQADRAGMVPSQGFRLPGHIRSETKKPQALLYFNPDNLTLHTQLTNA